MFLLLHKTLKGSRNIRADLFYGFFKLSLKLT